MSDPARFLSDTETKVPIIRQPGEGKLVGLLRDHTLFKVLPDGMMSRLWNDGMES